MRHFNRKAIKDHALHCSKTYRAGKFKRVSVEFIEEVETDVEAVLRKLTTLGAHPQLHAPTGIEAPFVTGDFISLVRQRLDTIVADTIQRKVERHPTVGKTLMRVN